MGRSHWRRVRIIGPPDWIYAKRPQRLSNLYWSPWYANCRKGKQTLHVQRRGKGVLIIGYSCPMAITSTYTNMDHSSILRPIRSPSITVLLLIQKIFCRLNTRSSLCQAVPSPPPHHMLSGLHTEGRRELLLSARQRKAICSSIRIWERVNGPKLNVQKVTVTPAHCGFWMATMAATCLWMGPGFCLEKATLSLPQ